MAPKQNKGETQGRAAGNSATDHLPGKSSYLPLGSVSQDTNEGHRRTPLRSVGSAVISVGVIDEKSFTRECITRCLQAVDHRFAIEAFATCEDCLRNIESYDLILYHAHEDISKWDNTNQRLIVFKKLLNSVPVVILSAIENPDSLIEMFESGARAFIPTDTTTLAQIIEIIGLVKVGGIFVPLSSLSLHRTKGQSGTAGTVSNDQFTRSELAVLDRLKLGKSNKIIAHELGLSESTVKLRIGRMMRKLKATNRTQIVSRAYALAAEGTRSNDAV